MMYFRDMAEVSAHFAMHDGEQVWEALEAASKAEKEAEARVLKYEADNNAEAPDEYYDAWDRADKAWSEAYNAFTAAAKAWMDERKEEIEFATAF